MKKFYFTFGQSHAHSYNGKTFDKDSVVEIEAENSSEAREKMFKAFGPKWSMQYDKLPDMSFFPRGVIIIDEGGYTMDDQLWEESKLGII